MMFYNVFDYRFKVKVEVFINLNVNDLVGEVKYLFL